MIHSPRTTAPSVHLRWTDPRLSTDPLPLLEQLREMGPVVYNEAEHAWLVLSYNECSQILSDPTRFSSSSLVDIIRDQFGGITMEGMDDQQRHGEIRGIWSKEFLRAALEKQRELVTRIVCEQLDPFIERLRAGEVLDAVSAATRRIPTLVIAHMLGLDPSSHEEFSRWTDAQIAMVAGGMDSSEQGIALVDAGKAATAKMNRHVACEISARRSNAASDLIGMGAQCKHISEEDLVANVTQLVVGGNETTARLMAVSLVVLANHPAQRRVLANHEALLRPAVEELLRYETIVQWMSRTALKDVDVAGIAIPKNAAVACMLGAANRDPARWDRPNIFDIQRKHRAHLSFGTGMHTCLGLNLTRLELEIFLDRLIGKLPEWEIAEAPNFGRSFPIRGPERVLVKAT